MFCQITVFCFTQYVYIRKKISDNMEHMAIALRRLMIYFLFSIKFAVSTAKVCKIPHIPPKAINGIVMTNNKALLLMPALIVLIPVVISKKTQR